jgi:hypothetical protein
MPTNLPALSNNGPPELPGFAAALVWITPVMGRPDRALVGFEKRRIEMPYSDSYAGQRSPATVSPSCCENPLLLDRLMAICLIEEWVLLSRIGGTLAQRRIDRD